MPGQTAPTPRGSSIPDRLLNEAVRELSDRNYEDAILKLNQAAEFYEQMNNTLGLAMTHYNLGVATLGQGNEDGAFGRFVDAVHLFTESNWPAGISLAERGADVASSIREVE